jgi:hypothetical protein
LRFALGWKSYLYFESKAWEGKHPVLSRLEALNCIAWLQKKFFGHKRSSTWITKIFAQSKKVWDGHIDDRCRVPT